MGKQTNNTKKVNENDREIGDRINQGIIFAKTAKETINRHTTQFIDSSRSPLTDSPNHTVHRLSTLTTHRRSTPPNPQIAP